VRPISGRSDATARAAVEDRPEVIEMRTAAKMQTHVLSEVTVADAMHPGVLTCPIETPLSVAARMMATYNVHCLVVYGSDEEHEDGEVRVWAVLSDLDLVAAALVEGADEATAGGSAGTPVVLIGGNERLTRAAQLMTEHQTAHLVVIDPDTYHPVGIVSTLDVAAALAGRDVVTGPPRVERH
jgi:CBS domain-containing protein